MTEKKLQQKVDAMSLEEKALQLTQYPAEQLVSDEETVVTGVCKFGAIRRESLWRMGTTLNAWSAATVREIRKRRRESGNDDPLPFMLDVIHGYRTVFPIPLAQAASFDRDAIRRAAAVSARSM